MNYVVHHIVFRCDYSYIFLEKTFDLYTCTTLIVTTKIRLKLTRQSNNLIFL